MPSQVFPFDNPANYSLSDSDKLEITLGKAQLKLINDPDNDFNEDFADGTGHTIESAKGEFLGGQFQQKLQVSSDALCGSSFNSTINLESWSLGVVTGTAYGGAAISGNKLDLAHADVRYVKYDASDNADMQQIGAIKFKITPHYSGSPSTDQNFFAISKETNSSNLILIRHNTAGKIYLLIYSYQQVGIVFSDVYDWNPTADTPYEFELNFDITVGATRLFIEGTQFGETWTGTGIRNTEIDRMIIGTNLAYTDASNFYIEDLIIFNSVQHTANYTPGYTVSEYKYLETYDLLPEMHYTGAGTLIEATDFQTSFSGSPRIAIDIGQSGEYTYLNGSVWVTGGDDYDHATSPADFLANIATLPVNGETYGQFIVYYPNSNTQSAFADLTITLTSQIYPIDNPYLDIISTWYIDDLEAISMLPVSQSGSDEIKLALKKGTQFYYISGGVLTASDGTYSQSNTVAEWETYKTLFTSIKTLLGIRVFLHSDDGTTTPEIDTLTVQYSFAGDTPDTVDKCIVWGTFLDELGDPMIGPIKVTLTDLVAQYKTGTMIRRKSPVQEMELDSTGNGKIELVETENMTGSQTYNFQFDNNVVRKRRIPNQATANFFDLTE